MHKKFRVYRLKCLLLGLTFSSLCDAGSIATLWDMARNNEPTYLSAKTSVEAAKARADQAFGEMLPKVNLNANSNYNTRDYQTRNQNIKAAQDQYNSHSTQLNLTQPLWRRPNVIGRQQAETASLQAEQQLENVEQELLAKVVSAWLDFLGARDQQLFTQQQVISAQHRQIAAERGYEIGLVGQPELEDVKAKLEQANSDQVLAETDTNVKRAMLEQLVGDINQLAASTMRDTAELANLSTEQLDAVLAKVQSDNHNVLAAQHAYTAATAEVTKQRAGHQPTLDLVASYGKNSQSVGGFPGQDGYDINQGSIGLQLNIPIYAGGIQTAKVVEAAAQLEKARLDIELAKRTAVLSAKQAWYGWQSAYAKTRAAEQSIKAANTALHSAKVALDLGLKSEIVILEAQQQLLSSTRDYNKSRYDQLANHIKLKAVMAALTNEDVLALDALFQENTAQTNAQKRLTSN